MERRSFAKVFPREFWGCLGSQYEERAGRAAVQNQGRRVQCWGHMTDEAEKLGEKCVVNTIEFEGAAGGTILKSSFQLSVANELTQSFHSLFQDDLSHVQKRLEIVTALPAG